ncbi:MAG: AAA family ATPase [Puniceicoccales bacterium]|jgi:BioD-like phosphotransacetylase family protein|nr:AAA family ATPase [Puniceicoccales bacterium]
MPRAACATKKHKETTFAPDVAGLLSKPLNTTTRRVFIAATRQNDGKTTTCLGLYGALRALGLQVGYIKPVAQRIIEVDGAQVDEDTQLINKIYDVGTPIEAMSPVAIDPCFTRRYLEAPHELRPKIIDRICRCFDRAAFQKDIIIIEGSGHAGVGSVFSCSNAHNARLLGSKCILVAGGGIGKPIDEIAMNKALLDAMNVECIGVILNKVIEDKKNFITEFAGRALKQLGLPLLGVLTHTPTLTHPNLSQIVSEIGGEWLHHPLSPAAALDHTGGERVEKIVIGAMSANNVLEHADPNALFIIPGDRDDVLFALIAGMGQYRMRVACGIILTNGYLPSGRIRAMLAQTDMNVVATSAESYDVARKINAMTVKIQPGDADKIPVVERLIRENINLPALLKKLQRD